MVRPKGIDGAWPHSTASHNSPDLYINTEYCNVFQTHVKCVFIVHIILDLLVLFPRKIIHG